ncbi:MAG: ATP-binding protein [Thiotrichaceae bacterium]
MGANFKQLSHQCHQAHETSGKILIGVRRQQTGVRLEVWDNGQGVPETEQHKIFKAFYQVNNPERHHSKGVGLGLTIVKRLADLMECQLTFRTTFGHGCCFSLHIPSTTQPPISVFDTLENLPAETHFDVKYNILIIEDDERIVEPLIVLLSNWGLAAQAAYNIETAMQTVAHFSPDLVILDYQLRDNQTGLEVLEQVRQRLGYALPAILLTGTMDEEYTQIFKTLPFPVLYKPVEPERLKTTMMQLLLLS